jgi:hypothetical protein
MPQISCYDSDNHKPTQYPLATDVSSMSSLDLHLVELSANLNSMWNQQKHLPCHWMSCRLIVGRQNGYISGSWWLSNPISFDSTSSHWMFLLKCRGNNVDSTSFWPVGIVQCTPRGTHNDVGGTPNKNVIHMKNSKKNMYLRLFKILR